MSASAPGVGVPSAIAGPDRDRDRRRLPTGGPRVAPAPDITSEPSGDDGADGLPPDARGNPAPLLRLGSMARSVLEEIRREPLDEDARARVRELHRRTLDELMANLSPEIRGELTSLVEPFAEEAVPSQGELRIADAQLVGWLEGLFQGAQIAVMSQQMAARQQLEQLRAARSGGPGEPGRAGEHGQ